MEEWSQEKKHRKKNLAALQQAFGQWQPLQGPSVETQLVINESIRPEEKRKANVDSNKKKPPVLTHVRIRTEQKRKTNVVAKKVDGWVLPASKSKASPKGNAVAAVNKAPRPKKREAKEKAATPLAKKKEKQIKPETKKERQQRKLEQQQIEKEKREKEREERETAERERLKRLDEIRSRARCLGLRDATSLIIPNIDTSSSDVQVLVVAETRERANYLGRMLKATVEREARSSCVYICNGGEQEKNKLIKGGIHVVTGIPDGLAELIRLKALAVNMVEVCVLDKSADQLNKHGFTKNISEILLTLPPKVLVLLLPKDEKEEKIPEPILPPKVEPEVVIEDPAPTVDILDCRRLRKRRHFYIRVASEAFKVDRVRTLMVEGMRLAAKARSKPDDPMPPVVIFCRSRQRVENLSRLLKRQEDTVAEKELSQRNTVQPLRITVAALHGDMETADRDVTIREFHQGTLQILVAQNEFACAIDASIRPIIINLKLFENIENYSKRITLSAGKARVGEREGESERVQGLSVRSNHSLGEPWWKSSVISIITDEERGILQHIENLYKITFEEMNMNVVWSRK